ncbi:MAG: hypothetical protein IKT46_04375 [Clostridia bacterium]|nr:hypothetical protein [Clostridia bacterium]
MSEDIFSQMPEKVAKSWNIHVSYFGSILESAFVDDIPTRIQLTAALNHISKFDPDRGIQILSEIEERCVCDEDRCAWLFCMGLGYEYARKQEISVSYYYQCCQYSPRFYLPYIKVAKSAHINQNFALAKDFYRLTIQSITDHKLKKDKNMKLAEASAASNLASCYTMMHDLPMAAMMLEYSSNLVKDLPGRNGAYAMLYAAMGDKENAELYLNKLKEEDEWTYQNTVQPVSEIIAGVHPHFHVINPVKEYIDTFWEDFTEKEAGFREQLDSQNDGAVCEYISDIMTKSFPCMQKKLRVRASKDNDGYLVELSDYYTATMIEGYKSLISDMPLELKKNWNFISVHD